MGCFAKLVCIHTYEQYYKAKLAILGPKKCIFSSFKVFLLELKQKHVLKLGDLKAFLKASLKNFIHNCINTKRNIKNFEH